MQRFRGGLVFKAHRLLYHSTLGLRVITKRRSWCANTSILNPQPSPRIVRSNNGPSAFYPEREFFIDNLLVRVHVIVVMIRWTGLASWDFEFPFPGSLTSTFLDFCPTFQDKLFYALSSFPTRLSLKLNFAKIRFQDEILN